VRGCIFLLGPARREDYPVAVKHFWSILSLSFVLFVASVAFGAVPPISVTVSDDSGRVASKVTTNASGTFTTAKLKPGNYIVRFQSSSGAMKGNRYAIALNAGTQKAWGAATPGEKFVGAGVTMKMRIGMSIADALEKFPGLNNPAAIRAMEREQASLNITGQVTATR
jgi:hypothetical protein